MATWRRHVNSYLKWRSSPHKRQAAQTKQEKQYFGTNNEKGKNMTVRRQRKRAETHFTEITDCAFRTTCISQLYSCEAAALTTVPQCHSTNVRKSEDPTAELRCPIQNRRTWRLSKWMCLCHLHRVEKSRVAFIQKSSRIHLPSTLKSVESRFVNIFFFFLNVQFDTEAMIFSYTRQMSFFLILTLWTEPFRLPADCHLMPLRRGCRVRSDRTCCRRAAPIVRQRSSFLLWLFISRYVRCVRVDFFPGLVPVSPTSFLSLASGWNDFFSVSLLLL